MYVYIYVYIYIFTYNINIYMCVISFDVVKMNRDPVENSDDPCRDCCWNGIVGHFSILFALLGVGYMYNTMLHFRK